MARDPEGLKISTAWASAASALKASPESISLVRAAGWPASYSTAGGDLPPIEVFNQIWLELTSYLRDIGAHGILEWNSGETYAHPSAVIAPADNRIYLSVQAGGQAQEPSADTSNTYWVPLIPTTLGSLAFATAAQVEAGSSLEQIVTPGPLLSALFKVSPNARWRATVTRYGLVRIGSQTEIDAGAAGVVVTGETLQAAAGLGGAVVVNSSETVRGIIRTATQTEGDAGTGTGPAMTPILVQRKINALSAPIAARGTDAADLVSGIVGAARLGTGLGNGKFLRRDSQWVDPFLEIQPVLSASGRNGSLVVGWGIYVLTGGSAIVERQLQWKSGAQSYNSTRQQSPINDNPATIPLLGNGTEYTLRFRARNVTGWSPWSAEITATPATSEHVVIAAGTTTFTWPWSATVARVIAYGGGGGGANANGGDGDPGGASSVSSGGQSVSAAGGGPGTEGINSPLPDFASPGGNGGAGREANSQTGGAGRAGDVVVGLIQNLAVGSILTIVVGAGGMNGYGDSAGDGGPGRVVIVPIY